MSEVVKKGVRGESLGGVRGESLGLLPLAFSNFA